MAAASGNSLPLPALFTILAAVALSPQPATPQRIDHVNYKSSLMSKSMGSRLMRQTQLSQIDTSLSQLRRVPRIERRSVIESKLLVTRASKKLKVEGVVDRFVYADGNPKVAIPTMLFDTSFLKKKTGNLTVDAVVDAGFRGVVSNNFPKENFEEGVGLALEELKKQGYRRTDYFVQTRFVPSATQEAGSCPYDSGASLPIQIRQSFISSQKKLKVDKLDAFLWEGATSWMIVRERDMDGYAELENLFLEGRTKLIGIGYFMFPQLKEIYQRAEVKPMIYAMPLHGHLGWERDARKFCQENGIIFQALNILNGNDWVLVLKDDTVLAMAYQRSVSSKVILLRFALQAGMVNVIDVDEPYLMREYMQVYDIELSPDEMWYIETMDRRFVDMYE
eukprot:jgi/Bigna1/87750/estExt_fgenesh1_pg.C_230197